MRQRGEAARAQARLKDLEYHQDFRGPGRRDALPSLGMLGGGLLFAAVLSGLSWAHRSGVFRITPEINLGLATTLLVLGVGQAVFWTLRSPVMNRRITRRFVFVVIGLTAALTINRLLALRFGWRFEELIASDQLLCVFGGATTAIFLDRNIAVSAAAFLVALILTRVAPQYALDFTGVAGLVAHLQLAYIWRKER